MKYNGNDVFAPFNAGLYGYEDIDIKESKESIMLNFKLEFENEISKTLKKAGITYLDLEWWSPKEYNFATDSIDLECVVENPQKLKEALLAQKEEIEAKLKTNKSYDGYIALTADSFWELLPNAMKGNVDIIAIQVLLSDISFQNFEMEDHLIWDHREEELSNSYK